MTALPALPGVHAFPVRHHSPRASAVLAAWLDRVRPTVVLIEGPDDADALAAVLTDPETVPPVALLAWRTDGESASAMWPFADYSPELVALRWAARRRVPARFIDLPTTLALAEPDGPDPSDLPDAATRPASPAAEAPGAASEAAGDAAAAPIPANAPGADAGGPAESDEPANPADPAALASRLGHRSFEELWEASFEVPAHGEAGFTDALLAWAALVTAGPRLRRHQIRDAWMLRHIRAAMTDGAVVAVIAGAAHVAAWLAGEVDEGAMPTAPPVATSATVIPYSFRRLSEQVGYGAGNRAPRYYQRAWERDNRWTDAGMELLVDLAGQLRLRGFTASLADVIEAWRLALQLAGLRDKHGPTLDDLRDAAVATLGRGEAAPIDAALQPLTQGATIGRVARRVGRNALQEELWREIRAYRLPATDALERFTLKLTDALHIGASTFLHRLRVADVPYASLVGAAAGGSDASDEAGGLAALQRVRETWDAQWTPATEVALAERIVLGDTLAEVAGRQLDGRLRLATVTGAAADVLLEAVVCDCPDVVASALLATDSHASQDDDLPSLARAARALAWLATFRAGRVHGATEVVIRDLCARIWARALARAPIACVGNDDAASAASAALRTLAEVAAGTVVDRDGWYAAAAQIAASATVHPACAGTALGLLTLADQVPDLADRVGFRLSGGDPADGAAFLEGFLRVDAMVLCRNPDAVAALDAFLQAIPDDRFVPTLPQLRRAFSALGATERRYLLEGVLRARSLGAFAAEARVVVESADRAAVEAVAGDLGALMDELDDLF